METLYPLMITGLLVLAILPLPKEASREELSREVQRRVSGCIVAVGIATAGVSSESRWFFPLLVAIGTLLVVSNAWSLNARVRETRDSE